MPDSPWSEEFEQLMRAHCARGGPLGPLDPDAPFSSLGIDSVGLLGIVVDSEELFDIEIPVEFLNSETLVTPRTFWAALHSIVEPASEYLY